jgi:uncharacterized protein YjbI with pentapeptide repeats
MNYTQLTAAIKGFAENDFPATVGSFTSADQIARFVQLSEQSIFNTVQMPAFRKNMTGNTTSGNRFLATPSDWLATFSLAVINAANETSYLLNKDVNFIRESYPDTDAAFYAEPEYYAIFDDNTFILGPTPDASYAVELHYFYYPESIVTAGTSWLGNNFDSALLYGALLEAANFMKSDADTVNLYKARFDRAMTELKQLGDAKDRQDAYRSGQVRYPVR